MRSSSLLVCYLPQKTIYINVLEESFMIMNGIGRHQLHTVEVFAS
nr:MAG TPA: hypothetical protein [Bacteriophage sp.]